MSFIRYTLTGGIATGAHYAMLLTLVEGLRLEPPPSTVFGALCGALVAYAGNRQFTFSSRAPHRRTLPRFLLVAAAGAGLNGAVVWAGTTLLTAHYLTAQIAATALVLSITYYLNRLWTFP